MVPSAKLISPPSPLFKLAVWIAFSLLAMACSDSSERIANSKQEYLPIANPVVENPPQKGRIILELANYDLTEVGYMEREFFVSGTASAFVNTSDLQSDGLWDLQPDATADYETRIVVLRPIDPADFSGTIYVEWLNTTSGQDSASCWRSGHTDFVSEGHVWVGVSAQAISIEGSQSSKEQSLKVLEPERYGSLAHPGDSFSYDIFSQVTQAIRSPVIKDFLDGLSVENIIATGSAQSGGWLVTYINGIHPLYNPYQGYLLRVRGRGGSPPISQPPQNSIATPEVVTIRDDLNVPVLAVQSETELFRLPYDREEDGKNFRIWEIAGAAHTDRYFYEDTFNDKGNDPLVALVRESNLDCENPINSGPLHWVFNAAIHSISEWTLNDIDPPYAERLALTDDGGSFEYDLHGNVLGGIRTPYVDAPAAILSGESRLGAGPLDCYWAGNTELFDAESMVALYTNKQGYIQAVSESADDAVSKGFLLSTDAELIKAAASEQWDTLGI